MRPSNGYPQHMFLPCFIILIVGHTKRVPLKCCCFFFAVETVNLIVAMLMLTVATFDCTPATNLGVPVKEMQLRLLEIAFY